MRSVVLAALVAVLCAPATAIGAPRVGSPLDDRDYAEGVVLVGFDRGANPNARAATRGSVNAQAHGAVSPLARDVERLKLPHGASVEDAVKELRTRPGVRFAEPDYVVRTDATSNDPGFTGGSLWGMYGTTLSPQSSFGTQASVAWNAGAFGSHSTVVGILDTGIDVSHPDLAPNMWTNPFEIAGNGIDDDDNGYVDDIHGWDFFHDDASVFDDAQADSHGTHVAGTVGAAGGNGAGVVGTSWAVTMISAKFIHGTGFDSGAIAALDYLVDLKVRHGLNIVATNNSWGGDEAGEALLEAINRAGDHDILFVAAAGNNGRNIESTPKYPASFECTTEFGIELSRDYDCIVSVAAINSAGGRASFSNYGGASVDIGAPGEGIVSTYPGGLYAVGDGTSMAAPHVTGAIALLASCQTAPTPSGLRSTVLGLGVPTPALAGVTVTGDRLDVANLPAACTDDSPRAVLSVAPGPTNATTLTYALAFSEPVTGLGVDSITRTGTATGCVVEAPSGSDANYAVVVTGCSAGTVILGLAADAVADGSANDGPTSAVTAVKVTIDRTAPTVGAPTTSFRTGASLTGTSVPLRLAWTGADAGGAGIARYEVGRSTDGGSTWTVVTTSLTIPVYDFATGTSGSRRFRVRPVDHAGNVGAWVSGTTFKPRLVQNTSAAIAYSGTWSTATNSSFSGGSVRHHSTAGRSASYTFTGRAVAFVTTFSANRGAVLVYINGNLQTKLKLFTSASGFQRVAWQKTWSSGATRTIRIEVVGTAGHPRIDLDALAVLR